MAEARKVFTIGLDSATFDVMGPLVKAGRLPNFARLIREGVSAELESVSPPVTPPAWVSFMTGKNPGKHGVFDFYGPPSLGYERPILNARFIKARTLWSLVSERGLRMGAVNVPLTHPPEKVNGFIVPGMQYSFDSEDGFTYPPALIEELKARLGRYEVAWGNLESLYTDELDEFLEQWRTLTELREKATLYLLETKPWDLFVVVFYSIDAIQHHFWKFFDRAHPLHDPKLAEKYGDVIPTFYQVIDEAVGKILRRLDDHTTVVVVSDHGAGPEHAAFYLNRWLMDEGLLVLKRHLSPLVQWKLPHFFYKALRRMKYPGISWTIPLDRYWLLKDRVDPREGLRISHFIDWTKTRAFAANHTEQGLYINLKGREPGGIVEPGAEYERLRDHLIEKLYQLVDPSTGNPLVARVYKREDLYHGPYMDQAADLFLAINGGSCLVQKDLHPRWLTGIAKKTSGTHRVNGVFIMKGAGVRRDCTLRGPRLIDLAPTILYSLGLPVPEDMDGKVLVDAFTEEFLHGHPVERMTAASPDVQVGPGTYAEGEGEKIRDALRGLGYMG